MSPLNPMQPILPLETVDLIMATLADDDDTHSLECCSLTCHSFLEVCRKYLFAEITIYHADDTQKAYQALRFHRLLTDNPGIADYVRQLAYIVNADKNPGPLVLHHLRRASSFTLWLRGHEYFQTRQDWDALTLSFRSYLSSFIESNQIVELRLLSIDGLPAMFFTHFPHLTNLALEDVSITHGPDDAFPRGPSCPKLVAFNSHFSKLGQLVKFLDQSVAGEKPVLDFTKVHSFNCLAADEDASMDAIMIVLRSAEAIETLGLHGEYPFLDFLGAFDTLSLGTLKALKKITISPMIEDPRYDPYAHFTEELDKIAGKNSVEELVVHINVSTDCVCTTDPAVWSRLDEVLSNSGGFPLLSRVEVKVALLHHSCDYNDLRDELKGLKKGCFPWCLKNEDLVFSFEVVIEDI